MKISDRMLKLAAKGDLCAIAALLEDNPRLLNAASGGHNRTLLWEAANAGRWDTVRFLIEAGADPNTPGRYRHETIVLAKPYCIAVAKKRVEIAEYLIQHGTEIDIYTAAYLGQMATVERWLAERPELLNQYQPEDAIWQVTALHHALAGMQLPVAAYLVESGAQVSEHASLLFDIACRRARMDLIEVLVNGGAEPKQADAFSVVRSSTPEIIDYFFTRGCSPEGIMPYVCRGDKGEHPDWVTALVRYGADVNETDDKGRTALHNAARAGFTRVIDVLVASGADVNARMKSGETPLGLAVRKKRHAAAELLRAHAGEG